MGQINFINLTSAETLEIDSIDKQHFELASLINKVNNSFINNDCESIKRNFHDLLLHMKLHFEHEEKLMIENKFDGFYSHKMEHQRFYSNLKMLEGESTESDKLFDIEILESIRRWYFNHIEIKDRKLAEYIKSIDDTNEKGVG